MNKILLKKYYIITGILFFIALLQTIIIQKNMFNRLVDLIVFSLIAILFPFITNKILKICKRLEEYNIPNISFFGELHSLNIVVFIARFGLANLLHIRSWSGIFLTFIVITLLLFFLQIIFNLLGYQIGRKKINQYLLKIYF